MKKLNLLKKIIFLTILLSACQTIQYKPDTQSRGSAQAGSNEFPTSIQGLVCKDVRGKVGKCIIDVKSTEDVEILHPARPYSYRLDVRCSMDLNNDYPVDVESGATYTIKIPSEKFEDFIHFTCKGEVLPYDRDQKVSASWFIKIMVVDEKYRSREIIYKPIGRKNYLVMGAHAKYSRVCDTGGCKDYEKKTIVKTKGEVKAFSESEVMRFNFKGY